MIGWQSMDRKIWVWVLVFFFLLLASCARLGNGGTRQADIAMDTIIIYEREGGFAGMSQEWVIHMDGTIEGPGDEQLAVPPEEVLEVVETGVESEIATLAPALSTPDACCDQFIYTITVISGDAEWSFVTSDSAQQPQEVSELFFMVQRLIAGAEPAP